MDIPAEKSTKGYKGYILEAAGSEVKLVNVDGDEEAFKKIASTEGVVFSKSTVNYNGALTTVGTVMAQASELSLEDFVIKKLKSLKVARGEGTENL
ncbi:MAG: hypothetical protein ACKO96_20520, partial [Flammeovirgaceae bacterium]